MLFPFLDTNIIENSVVVVADAKAANSQGAVQNTKTEFGESYKALRSRKEIVFRLLLTRGVG